VKKLLTLGLFFLFPFVVFGQTPEAPVTQAWSMNTSAVTLPGGKASIAGVDSGITFTPSANLDLFDRNLITSDSNLQYYAGGIAYRLPAVSTKANNLATNANFLRVRFSVLGSFGVARVFNINHYGYTAGVGVDYSLTQSGSWTFGGSGEYAQFPGYGSHVIVKVNAAFHF
jgi:hypothetical protein